MLGQPEKALGRTDFVLEQAKKELGRTEKALGRTDFVLGQRGKVLVTSINTVLEMEITEKQPEITAYMA